MSAPELQTLVQVFIERVVNSAVAGIVLTCAVWASLRFIRLRRPNSGTRFAIWFLVLLGIAALPFFAGSGFGVSHSPLIPRANLHSGIILSGSWSFALSAAWAVGAGLLLLRLSVGLWHVFCLRSNCREVDLASLDPAVADKFRDFNSRCKTKLCVSKQVTAPAAVGFFRPAIVFPVWLLPQLSAAEVEVILLHENAHLRRCDQWSNLVQKIVKAVFFFHPAVWWIESHLTLEREMACDEIVLAHSESPRAYASFLISFAEKLQNTRGPALIQALVSRMHQMSLRVTQILDAKPRRTGVWLPALAAHAGLLLLFVGAAPYVPQLVAFQNQPERKHAQQIQELKAKDQPVAAAVASDSHYRVARPVVERLTFNSQPRAIAAAFKSRRGAASPRFAAMPHKVRLQKEEQGRLPTQETIVILQTTQYDASGSGVWTLRIWRVNAGQLCQRELESAIESSI